MKANLGVNYRRACQRSALQVRVKGHRSRSQVKVWVRVKVACCSELQADGRLMATQSRHLRLFRSFLRRMNWTEMLHVVQLRCTDHTKPTNWQFCSVHIALCALLDAPILRLISVALNWH